MAFKVGRPPSIPEGSEAERKLIAYIFRPGATIGGAARHLEVNESSVRHALKRLSASMPEIERLWA